MKKGLRLIAILLAVSAVLALAACGGNNNKSNNAKDTLNVGVFLDSGTLDPLFMTGKGGYLSVQRCYSEPMWDYTDEGEKFWVLATAFDEVPGSNGLEYILKVRDGVKFSNGNPLTAEDFLFTFKINKADPRAQLNVKGINVDKSKVIDDLTLDVVFDTFEASEFPGQVQMQIVDSRTYNTKDYAAHPIGTGPYVVKDYMVNSYVTCERRDDYWGDTPYFKTINFKCLAEESQRINALEAGDIDWAIIDPKDVETIEKLNLGSDVQDYGSSLVMDYNMSTISTKEAREAIAYAVDVQSIVNVAYNGKSGLLQWGASMHLLEVQDRYYNMSPLYTDRYNLTKAKELAQKAGIVGKKYKILTNGQDNYIAAAEIILNGLQLIGCDGEILKTDQATYFDSLMADVDYDLAINTAVAPSNLPCDLFGMYPFFIPQHWTGETREKLVALGADSNHEPDVDKRMDLVYDLLKMHNDNLLWFGLCEDPVTNAYNASLKGTDQHTSSGLTLFQKFSY